MIKKWKVNKDVERTAPKWLAVRFGYEATIIYSIFDGVSQEKGVRINGKVANAGDVICYNGCKLYIEKGGDHRISQRAAG